MIQIRSFLFLIWMYGGTTLITLSYLLLMPLPSKFMRYGSKFWAGFIMVGLKYTAGIRFEIRGLDKLPEQGALIACKHQSAWETAIFIYLRVSTAYVLKKELLKIPLFGWYLMKAEHIAVDRSAGAKALKDLVRGVNKALEQGRNVVIFPEGTRSAAGKPRKYQPGIAALYSSCQKAVVPVALNSGTYWGRKSFLKKPGTIIMEVMDPIAPGMKRTDFLKHLEETIEGKTAELEAEAALTAKP